MSKSVEWRVLLRDQWKWSQRNLPSPRDSVVFAQLPLVSPRLAFISFLFTDSTSSRPMQAWSVGYAVTDWLGSDSSVGCSRVSYDHWFATCSYALSLPVQRWSYVILRFCPGLLR